MVPRYIHRKLRIYKIDKEVYAISLLVGIYGLYVIGSVLASQFTHRFHRFMDMPSLQLDISILFGLSIIYLATILKRRKRNAWLVTVAAYFLYMLFGIYHLIHYRLDHHLRLAFLVRDVIGPIIILGFLYISKHKFTVKSDVRSFQSAIRLIIILIFIKK
jgi:hypothetical protein